MAPVSHMLWAVAGRFHLDGHGMKISKLRFWYDGHVAMSKEEKEAMEKNGK